MCSTSSSVLWIKLFMTGSIHSSMQIFRTMPIFPMIAFLMLTGGIVDARAAGDVSVKAELSRSEVNAGEMAELQLKVTGSGVVDVPQEVAVEGLQIRLTGQSTQVQMVNFKVSSSVVYSYIVMPLRTGNFTSPSIPVRSNAGLLTTTPLHFSVLDAGAAAVAASPGQPSAPMMPGFSQRQPRPVPHRAETGKIAFGELSCSKKSLYAGEMVPVEIRYYFDARYPVQVRGKVDFGGEGVLVERFPEPKQSHEDREGVTYNVLTFHTLLSAVKAGAIDIAPAKLDSQIQMPGALPPGFDDPVFQKMLGGQNPFNQTQDLAVKTAPLHLEVLPLPKEGRPASFAGAVGQFDIDAMVANPHPAPGDPAVLTVKIGGKGNFKAMGAPILTDTEGWRSYPPTDKFEGSDELSYAGVKSFDFTLIAQQQMHASPGSEFSYFDPVTAKYETVATKPIPLDASPASSAGTQPSSVSTSTPPPGNKTSETKVPGVPKEEGLLGSMTLRWWKTPVQRPEFLIASASLLVAAGALAGALHFLRIRKQGGTPAARRRRRLAELWASLNGESLDGASSYDAAIEYAGLFPSSVDRDEILEELTARRDILKYGVGRSIALGKPERDRLLEGLGRLSTTNAR